jgi:hypothetical protein
MTGNLGRGLRVSHASIVATIVLVVGARMSGLFARVRSAVCAVVVLGVLAAGVTPASAFAGSPFAGVLPVAGTGFEGPSLGLGGAATSAALSGEFTTALAVFADGSVAVASDTMILRIDATGRVTRLAGDRRSGRRGDGGPAVRARFSQIRDLAVTPDGALLVADSEANTVRRIAPDGLVTRLAGRDSDGGFAGDGGPATAAMLCAPWGVSATTDGGVLIADSCNHRVREVGADGIIRTVAGTGRPGVTGAGGPAAAAQLRAPHEVTALPGGALVVDEESVRRIDGAGILRTVLPSREQSERDRFPDDVWRNALPMSDGALLLTLGGTEDPGRGVFRLAPNRSLERVAGAADDGFDGDGGGPLAAPLSVDDLALAPGGDVFMGEDWRVRRLTLPGSTAFGAAITRETLPLGRHARVAYAVTAPARLLIRLESPEREVTRRQVEVPAGRGTVALPGALAADLYDVRLEATALDGSGRTSGDRLLAVGGGVLSAAVARDVVESQLLLVEEIGGGEGRVGRCERFGGRRVDCQTFSLGTCQGVVSVVLRRDGILTTSRYAAGSRRCRIRASPRHPDRPMPIDWPVYYWLD